MPPKGIEPKKPQNHELRPAVAFFKPIDLHEAQSYTSRNTINEGDLKHRENFRETILAARTLALFKAHQITPYEAISILENWVESNPNLQPKIDEIRQSIENGNLPDLQ
jgi:hypothetical protein